MGPRLFDPLPRVDQRMPRRLEPCYAYLNESARPEAALARAAYREWLTRYPAAERDDVVRRFRSKRDDTHMATAFELAVHEAMVGLGASVGVPGARDGMTRYDFDVEREGEDCAVEVALVTDTSKEDERRADQRARLLDALDEVQHPRLGVHVWSCQVADQQPSFKRIRADVVNGLNGASEAEIAQWAGMVAARQFDRLPRWMYLDGRGTKISLSPVPLPPGLRKLQLNPPGAMQRIMLGKAFLKKIREKASQGYDLGSRPLVVVLGAAHWHGSTHEQVFEALFGTERHVVREREGKLAIVGSFRDRDGVWGPHSRHGLSSVSAVLVFERFQTWGPWATRWHAYVNPWARFAPPAWLSRLPRWAPVDSDHITFQDGARLSDVLRPPFEVT